MFRNETGAPLLFCDRCHAHIVYLKRSESEDSELQALTGMLVSLLSVEENSLKR